MILQALYDYYQKHPDLPEPGYESKEFKFEIIIDKKGRFLKLNDLRSNEKKQSGHFLHVPLGVGRTSGITPYCLWDHYGYVLGESGDASETKQEKAPLQFKSFQAKLQSLSDEVKEDEGVHAVLEFYRTGEYLKVKEDLNWKECSKIPGCNLTFRLDGSSELVAQRPAVRAYIREQIEVSCEEKKGRCLITGKYGSLVRLMKATPIPGGQATAALVSFQISSGYDSYGKKQLYNAPMSIKAEFACTTALSALLAKDSKNRYFLGGITFVFWLEKEEKLFNFGEMMTQLFGTQKDSPDFGIESMVKMLNAVRSGYLSMNDQNRFYFLGLAPNAARIAIQTWRTGTVKELASNIAMHFEDFEMLRPPKSEPFLGLGRILGATALEYKLENVPNNLEAKCIDSILTGSPYPEMLFQATLRRIRATHEITWVRSAILKACLNRKNRFFKLQHKEILMSLDIDNPNIGYQCGRLFAVLEKCQEEANPGINATIRDRFYGSASSTPRVAFPNLMKINVHHISKISGGRGVNLGKLLQEIVGRINDFPAHLNLEEQGRFAIGYYHQRQFLFTKNETEKTTPVSN